MTHVGRDLVVLGPTMCLSRGKKTKIAGVDVYASKEYNKSPEYCCSMMTPVLIVNLGMRNFEREGTHAANDLVLFGYISNLK